MYIDHLTTFFEHLTTSIDGQDGSDRRLDAEPLSSLYVIAGKAPTSKQFRHRHNIDLYCLPALLDAAVNEAPIRNDTAGTEHDNTNLSYTSQLNFPISSLFFCVCQPCKLCIGALHPQVQIKKPACTALARTDQVHIARLVLREQPETRFGDSTLDVTARCAGLLSATSH